MEAMSTNGYDEDFSAAVTASSTVIGPIFPPSIPLIIYGSVASVSVSQLFMGGVVPGLMMAFALMVMVFIFAIKRSYKRVAFSLVLLIKQFFCFNSFDYYTADYSQWIYPWMVYPNRSFQRCSCLCFGYCLGCV